MWGTLILGTLKAGLGPVWLIVRGLFTANGFLAALIVGGAVAFGFYDKSRVNHGMILEAAKRDKANADAVETARRGRTGAGGKRMLDPYTRTE
jgi:hypothetical protein